MTVPVEPGAEPKLARVTESADRPSAADVVIIGGGLIGIRDRLAARPGRGRRVIVAGEPDAAASQVAAGMLAPVTETTFTEQALLPLNLASLRRYPDFAAEVEAGQRPAGRPAADADPLGRLRRRRRRPADAVCRVPRPGSGTRRTADQPGSPQARAAAGPDDP